MRRVTDPVFGLLSHKNTWWSGEAEWSHTSGPVAVMIFSGSGEPTEQDRRVFIAVRSAYSELLPEISQAVLSLWKSASGGADVITSEQLFNRLHLECVCVDRSGSVDLMYEGSVGLFTVRVDNGMATRVDRASRIVRASPSAIYRAFVSAAAVEKWLPPQGMTGSVLAFDFREGGSYRMRLTHNAKDHVPGKTSDHSDEVEVRFLKLEPNRRIEQAVTFDTHSAEFSGEMKVIWTLEPTDGATNVRVTCEDVPPGIKPEDHEAGLRSTLENLAAFIEGDA